MRQKLGVDVGECSNEATRSVIPVHVFEHPVEGSAVLCPHSNDRLSCEPVISVEVVNNFGCHQRPDPVIQFLSFLL